MLVEPLLVNISATRKSLCRDYTIYACNYKIILHGGATTDGDSVPKIFQWILNTPWYYKCIPAAIVHDNLYENHTLPRYICDRIYYHLNLVNGYDPTKAFVKYASLRCFGWLRYKQGRKHQRDKIVVRDLSKN